MRRGVTTHAIRRARERYGVEMSPALWAALADSIRDGQHQHLGRASADGQRYRVLLQRDDGSVLPMLVVYHPAGHCIVTCLPKPSRERERLPTKRRSRPGRKERRATEQAS